MARNKKAAVDDNAQRAGRKRGRQAAEGDEAPDQPEASGEDAADADPNQQVIEEEAVQAPDALGQRRAGWAAAARRYTSMPSNGPFSFRHISMCDSCTALLFKIITFSINEVHSLAHDVLLVCPCPSLLRSAVLAQARRALCALRKCRRQRRGGQFTHRRQ